MCNGQQPCLSCQLRGIDCNFPPRTTQLQIVQLLSTPCKALTIKEWNYVCLCFEAVGVLPQSAVFRSDVVIGLSHTNEQVSKTWCIVGQVYAASSGKDTLNRQQRDGIRRALATQTDICARQLKQSQAVDASVPLLCASLLTVTDLLIDDTGDQWRTRMVYMNELVGIVVNDVSELSPLDMELIRFFQLNDVLGSISRHENPLGPNFSVAMSKTPYTSTTTNSVTSSTLYADNYDHILSAMWKWSVLRQRIAWWIANASCQGSDHDGDDNNNHDYHNHKENQDNYKTKNNTSLNLQKKIQGIELVDEVTRLQSFILGVLLPFPCSSEPKDQYLDPYCRWMLVDISQLLQHQAMTDLECGLPIMPPACLREQALAALDDIEKMTGHSELDMGFFLPVVDVISREISSEGNFTRLLHFLGNVEARGFGIAREYRQEALE
ncbi:hypothetical protein KAF25_001521, partial [Fusarium avenaceum]